MCLKICKCFFFAFCFFFNPQMRSVPSFTGLCFLMMKFKSPVAVMMSFLFETQTSFFETKNGISGLKVLLDR